MHSFKKVNSQKTNKEYEYSARSQPHVGNPKKLVKVKHKVNTSKDFSGYG